MHFNTNLAMDNWILHTWADHICGLYEGGRSCTGPSSYPGLLFYGSSKELSAGTASLAFAPRMHWQLFAQGYPDHICIESSHLSHRRSAMVGWVVKQQELLVAGVAWSCC